jgi:hypothetical protein
LPQGRIHKQSTRRTELRTEQLSMLATVVVAFAALAALVLTGQAGIRQDLRALQTVMLAGQAELRNEMLAGQAELRKEMQTGQGELGNEVQTGQGELRNEMRAGQAELRKDIRALQVEMRAGQAELRAGQAGLREDLEALGVRLAVVEHRTDALDTRFAVVERRMIEWHAVADAPAAGAASPAAPPPGAIPFR